MFASKSKSGHASIMVLVMLLTAGGTNAGGGAGGCGGGGFGGAFSCNATSYYPTTSTENECTLCVSEKAKTTAASSKGETFCLESLGGNGATFCDSDSLPDVKIEKKSHGNQITNCIAYQSGDTVATILLPKEGTFKFADRQTKGYILKSIRLGVTIRGKLRGETVIGGKTFLRFTFSDTTGKLKRSKGRKASVSGVIQVQGGFDLCFLNRLQVCS